MQEFHAFQVSPGSEHSLEVPEGQGYHLSIVALPYNQSTGRSTLYVSVDGKSFAVGTVDAQRNIMQVTTDLIFNFEQKAVFQVKGTSAVHCVGYRQELDAEDEDMPFGFDDSEDEDGPLKLPVEQAHTGATVEQLDSDDGNEVDDLDDEEMSDDEEDDDDDEDDEEEDDEEDDEELAPTAADPTQAGPSSDDEEDDEDDEEEDDEEEDDEEEDDEEEDDEEEDDEEEMMPPTKASRPEARNSQSGASPAKSNSSPQQRGSQGSPQQRGSQGSPQQRGTPNRSSQGRRSH